MAFIRNFAVAVVLAASLFAHSAHAAGSQVGSLLVEAPWTRATPGGAKVAAGFLVIVNTGDQARRLTAAASAISERVEIHEMTMTGGVMRMRRLENGLELAPQSVTELKPGGYHLMFIGLKQPIAKGDKVTAELAFDGGDKIEITLVAAGIGAQHAPGAVDIRPSGSASGVDMKGSASGQVPQGSASGNTEHKGSH